MDVKRGFVFINVGTLEIAKVILTFTSHELPWCYAIYQ